MDALEARLSFVSHCTRTLETLVRAYIGEDFATVVGVRGSAAALYVMAGTVVACFPLTTSRFDAGGPKMGLVYLEVHG